MTEDELDQEARADCKKKLLRRARQARPAVPQQDRPDRLERPDDRRATPRRAQPSMSRSTSQPPAKAADFVLKHQKTKEGRLLRTYGAAPGQKPKAAVTAYLEDYAFLVHGLLASARRDQGQEMARRSRKLTDTMIKHHGDKKRGGYYFTAHDAREAVRPRARTSTTACNPPATARRLQISCDCAKLTGDAKYEKEAERTFKFFAGSLSQHGASLTTMAQALDVWSDGRPLEKKDAKK